MISTNVSNAWCLVVMKYCVQIQNRTYRAQLTNCPGALTKCQKAIWNRWDLRSCLNLLVSVVNLMLWDRVPGSQTRITEAALFIGAYSSLWTRHLWKSMLQGECYLFMWFLDSLCGIVPMAIADYVNIWRAPWKKPNMFHNYETEKITRNRDVAEYIELLGSSARDRHAGCI